MLKYINITVQSFLMFRDSLIETLHPLSTGQNLLYTVKPAILAAVNFSGWFGLVNSFGALNF